MIHAFIFGILLAFGLIMPLGMQNIFVFNQGATQRHFLHALPSVLTAFICDAILILLAVLGVSVAVLSLPWLKTVVYFVGLCFLLYMSWLTWHARPDPLETTSQPLTDRQQMVYAISVSLFNPHAIIDSIGVIGTNSLHFVGDARWAFTLGCILVSFIWFFSLAVAGHFVHKADKTGHWLIIINKISAIVIFAVAVLLAWKLLFAVNSEFLHFNLK